MEKTKTMRLVSASGGPGAPFDASDPNLEVWRDPQGAVCAYGGVKDGEYSFCLAGLGTFRFRGETDIVTVAPEPSARDDKILDAYRRTIVPMALQVRGHEVLHASAVMTDTGVIGLCGTSGTGKSTIAYGLSQRGHSPWADDALVLAIAENQVYAIPVPFRLRLLPNSASYFESEGAAHDSGLTWRGQELTPRDSQPLAALCILKRLPADDSAPRARAIRLTESDAFAQVLAHAYCFSFREKKRTRQMVRNYMDLVGRTDVLEISFQAGLDNLPAILDCIENCVAGAHSPSLASQGGL
jgi:hypothetical protein